MKILVADSDPKTIECVGLCCSIRWPHREIIHTDDAEEVLDLVEREAPDLVLLDLDLRGGSGYDACREIRAFSAVPIIMLSSVGTEDEIIKSLDVGADDCVAKPIRPLELLARMIALLRRTQSLPLVNMAEPFISGDLYIDFDNYEVRLDGREIKLTYTEFEILRCLVHNARRVISHTQLANQIWGDDGQSSRNALKVHIQHLRQKLGESAHDPRHIVNERGFGYKFIYS